MDIPLSVQNSNNDSNINVTTSSNNDSIHRIIDTDSTLGDIFYDDLHIINFLKITAFHWQTDYRDNYFIRVILSVWKISLLILAAIGFIWQMILGINLYAYELSQTSPYQTPTLYFLLMCFVYINLIIPVIQVTALIYTTINIKQFIQIPVNRSVILKLLPKTKRITFVYFFSFIMFTIVVDSCVITRTYYESIYHNDAIGKRAKFFIYSTFVFQTVSSDIVLNICEIGYTAVAVLVFSLKLEQIQLSQLAIINSVEQNTLTAENYYQDKDHIKQLQTSTYLSIQVLTIVAGINWIGILVSFLAFHELYVYAETSGYTYNDLINDDLVILPYLLKEAFFFFYVLWKAATINTLDDKIKSSLVKKCDELTISGKDNVYVQKQHLTYTSLSLNSIIFPIEFKLLGRRITRNDLVFSIVGTIIYTLSMIIKVNSTLDNTTSQ